MLTLDKQVISAKRKRPCIKAPIDIEQAVCGVVCPEHDGNIINDARLGELP
jgi:hypothetical protein